MRGAYRYSCLVVMAGFLHTGVAFGQANQLAKDVWVATSQNLFAVDGGSQSLILQNDNDSSRSFTAIAFEAPVLGGPAPVRNLIAVDGTRILRFFNGNTGIAPQLILDTAGPLKFSAVDTVAVTPEGKIIFSGYARNKRRFEMWQMNAGGGQRVLLATGMPQLTDAVYIDPDDVTSIGNPLAGGGILAASEKLALFFPADDFDAVEVIADVKSLPVTNSSRILSAEFAAGTNSLLLATSRRDILNINLLTGATISIAAIPDLGLPDRRCANRQNHPFFELRNIGRQSGESLSVIADGCRQLITYAFETASPGSYEFDELVAPAPQILGVAVGEGKLVNCPQGLLCELLSGYEAQIETEEDTQLLVLQIADLCDPRVNAPASTCYDPNYDADYEDDYDISYPSETYELGTLIINGLLPEDIADALDVLITLPPYMFAATPDARFGAVLVQPDENSKDALVTAELDLSTLLGGFELGFDDDYESDDKDTPLLELLNNDVVAYAPENPLYPTFNGFEATPISVEEGSVLIRKRGYSMDFFGLQHDVSAPSARTASGGIGVINPTGVPPMCDLEEDESSYVPAGSQTAYFLNLAACLFSDLEELLEGGIIPGAALTGPERDLLEDQLQAAEFELIDALNNGIYYTGFPLEVFEDTIAELVAFEALLTEEDDVTFHPDWIVYRNDLLVRSEVLRFYLLQRAEPSIITNPPEA